MTEVRGGAVGWGSALQVGRSRVRFPIVSLEFFIDIIFLATMALGLTQPLTEINTRNISWGQRRPVCRADKLKTFMCRLSWNLRASDSWKPQGLSRPVMGLLYLPDQLYGRSTVIDLKNMLFRTRQKSKLTFPRLCLLQNKLRETWGKNNFI